MTIGSMVRNTLAALMACTDAELKASYSTYSFILAASRMLRSKNGQRLEFGIVEIQNGVEKFIPVANGIEQADGQQNGFGEWQNHVPEHLQFICPIEAGRFFEFIGQAFEEAFHHQQVVDVDAAGQDHSPIGVDQVEFLHNQIGGDQAGIEQEWDHHHGDEKFATRQIAVREGIGKRNRQQHIDGHAAQRDNEAVGGCAQKGWMAEKLFVGFE